MKKISKTSAMHMVKLVSRTLLFLAVLGIYIYAKVSEPEITIRQSKLSPYIYGFVALIYIVEMGLRFFPSKIESMGCQKQFARNFIPTDETEPVLSKRSATVAIALIWILGNSVFGALYLLGIFDEGIMLLISLFYSVCDMICILYFCPFQTWMMKNKCCGTCRIYNWDFAMMFTPMAFIIHPLTLTLFGVSVALLIYWEVCLYRHPERFSERTNACLSCKSCKEKLCHHKTQLRSFLKKNRESLLLKGNTVIGKVKEKLKSKKDDE